MDRRRLLSTLGATAVAAAAAPVGAQARLRVVASFSILGDFVRAVAGDAVELTTLVGPDQDAHVYEPSPADARVLAAAQVTVVNGLGYEGWIDRLVASSGFKGLRIVASEGVATRPAAFRRGDPHRHRHSASDPHVWQDPRRAQAMVGAIARGLTAADPARARLYAANRDSYVARLDALETEIAGYFAAVPVERRKVIASHDAFAYFAERFAIAFRAPRGVSTEAEPSARDLARIINEIRREGLKVVFLENVTDPRLIEQIAREAGASLGGRLYSDALSAPSGPAPSYLAMMRHNALRMRDAMLAE